MTDRISSQEQARFNMTREEDSERRAGGAGQRPRCRIIGNPPPVAGLSWGRAARPDWLQCLAAAAPVAALRFLHS